MRYEIGKKKEEEEEESNKFDIRYKKRNKL